MGAAACANPPSLSSRRPQPWRDYDSWYRAHAWGTLLFASRKWLVIPTDCHSLTLQSSCHGMKPRQEGSWNLQRLPLASLLFRFRLTVRAREDKEAGKNVDSRPLNAEQYLSNETPSPAQLTEPQRIHVVLLPQEKGPQKSPSDIQYMNLIKEVPMGSNQTRDAEIHKHGTDIGIDAPQRSLEEDYGLLKEQVENDRKIQLASKQDSDVESTVKAFKRSKIVAKQVISQSSARVIGFASQLWVSVRLLRVVALEVRPSLLSGEIDRVFLTDVCQIGDVVLVTDESALENEMTASDCETLVGYDVVTEDGNYIGKIRDYSFDLQEGKLISLDFDSVGISLVPSSLISTYRLDVEEVMEVLTDSILVKEGAESRIKRLTKGFWQLPNTGEKRRSQKMARSRMRNRRFPESTDFTGQARPLPSRTRPRYFEGVDFEGSDAREEPADWGTSPSDYDRPRGR
ncbi:hypothetical protein GOP47_0004976 [Adiantum capillus-veneris]|uniref:PRC-barrel domain-containing protein n=1 Tax=Adiantum capillus-veneris TaxID=13818 RepID=A0A9D4V5W7_ADICA|nr:hypothetical protein GOP47_0004976 [Adiantum capillus-veneris]